MNVPDKELNLSSGWSISRQERSLPQMSGSGVRRCSAPNMWQQRCVRRKKKPMRASARR
jgi:hypothetical protein